MLTSGAELATWLNDTELASEYAANASTLKSTFNDVFWLADRGLYSDNETTTLCAQDGNSVAVVFNLAFTAASAGCPPRLVLFRTTIAPGLGSTRRGEMK